MLPVLRLFPSFPSSQSERLVACKLLVIGLCLSSASLLQPKLHSYCKELYLKHGYWCQRVTSLLHLPPEQKQCPFLGCPSFALSFQPPQAVSSEMGTITSGCKRSTYHRNLVMQSQYHLKSPPFCHHQRSVKCKTQKME